MIDPIQVHTAGPEPKPNVRLGLWRGLPVSLGVALLALCAGFALPLIDLVRFSLRGELYSYVLLVPFVSVYLFATSPRGAASSTTRHMGLAGALTTLGVAALALRWILPASGPVLEHQDALALTTFSFVALVGGAMAFFLERDDFKRAIFPLAFLLFMVPFPVFVEESIEMLLQHGSAPVAHWLFLLAGTTVYQHDLIFELPGIAIRVAPECSGIRSTIVLFMTSLVAGHLFLKSPWKRTLLTVAVIPLALVRNGFRIFTIGELCVRIGPHMIDSDIHHKGGSIFFALSLVPFFILVYFLVKSERPLRTATIAPAK